MKQKILAFFQDDVNDWVARLGCHHNQHVRHNPPLSERPWVETEEGRSTHLGDVLDCILCDQLVFPQGLTPYKSTPHFDETTVPKGLLKDHNTKAGVWAKILVESGRLDYTVNEPVQQSFVLNPEAVGIVAPEIKHRVSPLGKVKFKVVFYTLVP